jgi:hypothetical protein
MNTSCAPSSIERRTSSILREWKHAKLFTVELDDADFSKALEVFEQKTGIKFQGMSNEPKIKLTLHKAPFWQAVAELSTAAKASFFAAPWLPTFSGEESRIEFSHESGSCDYYQLIGPFHIGLSYRGTKEEPLALIQASALSTQGRWAGRGIRKVFLNSAGKKTPLEQRPKEGDPGPSRSHWLIPRDFVGKTADLSGEMECEVYLNSQDVSVPVEAPGIFKFEQFGGLTVSTAFQKKEKKIELSYTISWKLGLNAEDSAKLKELKSRMTQGVERRDEEEAVIDWLVAKSPDLQLLGVQKAQLIDLDDKLIPPDGIIAVSALDIQGKITFDDGLEPKELRLRLCEKKLAIAVFEFQGVLPRKWQ